MTVIVPEKVTCPGCGQPVQVYVLESWSTWGFQDFRRVDHVTCPNGHRIEGDFIEFIDPDDPDAQLQADPNFTEETDEELAEGETTEISFGEWIPGSRPLSMQSSTPSASSD
jgi:hypothetical protein